MPSTAPGMIGTSCQVAAAAVVGAGFVAVAAGRLVGRLVADGLAQACRMSGLCTAGSLYALTTQGQADYDTVSYAAGDVVVFGPETRGLPEAVLGDCPPGRQLRIPMRPGARSLNLSNAVAVVVYEAWRQLAWR